MFRKISLVMIAAAFLLSSAAGFAANSLDVNGAAAVEGSYGLELTFDGSNNLFYVRDNSPTQETTYRASFWLEEGTLHMVNCGTFCSTQFMFLAGMDASTGFTALRIIAGRMTTDGPSGERHLYRFSVRNDYGGFLYVGGVILDDSVVRKHITIEWQQGTPGGGDGIARLYTSNDGGTPNLQYSITYNNSSYVIDQVLIGGVAGLGDTASDAQTTGTLHFDSFESYRTLLP